MVMPLVVDEIGITGEREALGRLLTIADGDLPANAAPYLRVKAIEALGRLGAEEAIPTLRRIVETRKVFGWQYPQELRIAALQVLEKLQPEWVREFLPKSGIEEEGNGTGAFGSANRTPNSCGNAGTRGYACRRVFRR